MLLHKNLERFLFKLTDVIELHYVCNSYNAIKQKTAKVCLLKLNDFHEYEAPETGASEAPHSQINIGLKLLRFQTVFIHISLTLLKLHTVLHSWYGSVFSIALLGFFAGII